MIRSLYRRAAITTLALMMVTGVMPRHRIYSPQVKSLQVVANQDWLSPPVVRMGTDDVLHVAFDELSHEYHRYIYRLQHCEADWSTSEDIFESDWLEGFNDNPIDDYQHSLNTTVAYTHYRLQIPNDRCRLKLSGNYRLTVSEEGDWDEPVLTAEFYVTDQTMTLSMEGTPDTDTDTRHSHQQLSMNLAYGTARVTDPSGQIYTVVMQNGGAATRNGVPFTAQNQNGLEWSHCRNLIFDAGNEYRKFEVLDTSHPTMGIEHITWDGDYFQAFPFTDEPRPFYLYDEDADGAFFIRNSDNVDIETTSDYVWVNYRLRAPFVKEAHIVVDGLWTTSDNIFDYVLAFDETSGLYTARILQKQGYYNYQYLLLQDDGTKRHLPSEGSFYQTENRYQAFVYYRGNGDRTWRLTAFRQIIL